MEERIEVTGIRGKRSKQQLDELKEMRGFWNSEEEALDLMGSRLWKRRRY
jgi:hypothetical protein